MRRVLVTCIALVVAGIAPPTLAKPAAQAKLSIWNITVSTGSGSTKLTVFGGKPNDVLPACRCVAGIWRLDRKGESATHFKGTLQAVSSNHRRTAKKKLAVKVRKTRHLMGVAKDHRATLHGILRGSGQLILREVKGGDFEVVGYAPEPFGDLFTKNERWRADAKSPPAPAAPTPVIDPARDAVALAKLINDYRDSIGLPRVAISPALTKVARAHVKDLNVNKPVSNRCNMHSWSKRGSWTACCYDKSSAAARCMWVKPKEIAGYRGKGYEIAAGASGISPEQALSLWQQSEAHHAVMINKGIWKQPWRALGVAIEGDFAVAWFGEEADK